MKLIKEDDKTIIFLNDGENIEIKTMYGNPISICIECKNGSFLVDEVHVNSIKQIKIEQEQVEILKKYENKDE